MPQKKIHNKAAEFERALQPGGKQGRYVLRLYITGMTPRSQLAIENTKRTCEEHLKGRYELEIIDIYENPTLAEGEQIIAAPTLVKKLPLPLRRMVGDLTDEERVLIGLDLRPRK
ncbi:MAG TPA: circadian clock KaiB family protein [Planctomycetota bacterium]|jgi:circadian clock protein KaiB